MKSKLFVIMSILAVALMAATSANAQTRTQTRVELSCSANNYVVAGQAPDGTPISLTKVVAKMHNNTGAGLAAGKIISFSVKRHNVNSTFILFPKKTKVLDVMIPAGAEKILWEDLASIFTYSCTAWYFK